MKLHTVLTFITLVGCGDFSNNESHPVESGQPDQSVGAEEENSSIPTLTLPDSQQESDGDSKNTSGNGCKESEGNVLIKNRCYPAEISLKLNGEVSLGGIGTSERLYAVTLGQTETVSASDPYMASTDSWGDSTIQRHDNESGYNYVLSASRAEDKVNRTTLVNGYLLVEADVNLDVFGVQLKSHSTLKEVISFCDKARKNFETSKPQLNFASSGFYGSSFWLSCSIMAHPKNLESKEFDYFTIEWANFDKEIRFYRMVVSAGKNH